MSIVALLGIILFFSYERRRLLMFMLVSRHIGLYVMAISVYPIIISDAFLLT